MADNLEKNAQIDAQLDERQRDNDLDNEARKQQQGREIALSDDKIVNINEITKHNDHNNIEKKIIENSNTQQVNGNQANGIKPTTTTLISQNGTTEKFDIARKRTSRDAHAQLVKSGRVRHIIAILALSSIVLANMNRQAYNQALVRMIRRLPTTTTTTTLNHTSDHMAAKVILSSSTSRSDFSDYMTTESLPTNYNNRSDEQQQQQDDTLTTILETDENDDDEQQLADEGFDWSGSQIGLLQAAFSYGYTLFMIPGGRMSEIYGAKWVIFLSSFGSALCSLMTPFLANYSFHLLVGSRVLMGLCQTGISPALYALLSRWLPADESTVYLPMIKVGVMIGFMSGSLINGFLPWPSVFYSLGLLGFAWSAFWVFFASSLPNGNKFITPAEKLYIQQSLEQAKAKSGNPAKAQETKDKNDNNSAAAPWLRIIKNPVVLAFTFTKFTVKLSTDTQTMQIPMYLRNVFQISDQLNGILNGANFAIQAVFTGVVAYVAKEMVLNEQFGLHKTGIRRLFQGINCFGMSLAYLLISFNMGSLELVCCAVILLSVTSMFGAGGEAVLPIDLTTEYSASIMAIANSAANLSGIVLPPIVSFFLANQLTDSTNWNHIWWFISFVMSCGGVVFILMVKAKIQGFNDGQKKKQRNNNIATAGEATVGASKQVAPKAEKSSEATVAIEMTGNCTSSV